MQSPPDSTPPNELGPSGVHAAWALLPEGWRRDVEIRVNAAGMITQVEADSTPTSSSLPGGGLKIVDDPVIPAIPNLHSHAFQYALAGLAERTGPKSGSAAHDSFWTWRETMYRFLETLDPDGIERIATDLYRDLRAAGYGWVGEFHYVHHGPDGTPYDDPAETALRLLRAAENAGIGITILPVYYEDGGFGGQPPGPGQRRFLQDPDSFGRLLERLAGACRGRVDRRLGIAPHSLRAVRSERLSEVLTIAEGIDPTMPIHIHVAEQRREVDDCLAWSGMRPVRLLLDRFDVDHRWCLVHATHLDAGEIEGLAASGAVAGLCPTTEANLGDGIFPGLPYISRGGRFGIGSDSHVCVDPAEELRWLENTQRLASERRTVMVTTPDTSVAESLILQACSGGAQALGAPTGRIAVGCRADLKQITSRHDGPPTANEFPARRADQWVFSPSRISLSSIVL